VITPEPGAFDPKFKVGDFVYSERKQFRGWITRIEPKANKWPYHVYNTTADAGELFAACDLEIVEGSPGFRDQVLAHKELTTKITALRTELWALETAQRVIEVSVDEEWRKTYDFLTY
jgi:hypothetical protein